MLNAFRLHAHRRTYYSEAGEDGALEYLLGRLRPVTRLSRVCVEFGAGDGRHLSNTYRLVAAAGFAGLYIESDAARYRALRANMRAHAGVRCLQRRVGTRGPDALEAILGEAAVPADFDILSIDVDGGDYHVWRALERFRPKIVVVELNFRIKPGVPAIDEPGTPFVWGVSGTGISPMRQLGAAKGYGLVGNIGCNALFLRDDLLSRLGAAQSEHDAFTYEGFAWRELSGPERRQKGRFLVYRGCAALGTGRRRSPALP
jgi:hypothetical protein